MRKHKGGINPPLCFMFNIRIDCMTDKTIFGIYKDKK
jgi:hypothetical protein